jgi:hypothetical protein
VPPVYKQSGVYKPAGVFPPSCDLTAALLLIASPTVFPGINGTCCKAATTDAGLKNFFILNHNLLISQICGITILLLVAIFGIIPA